MENKYQKSLRLIDEFIAETPAQDLTDLIAKYKELNIEGVKFSEYLQKVNNQMAKCNLQVLTAEQLLSYRTNAYKYII